MAYNTHDEGLEDRLRRMILTEQSPTSTQQPVVRLPPTQSQQHNAYHHAGSFLQVNGGPQRGYEQHLNRRGGPHSSGYSRGPTAFFKAPLIAPDMQGDQLAIKTQYLEELFVKEIIPMQMTHKDVNEKHNFRRRLEAICNEVCSHNNMNLVNLYGFGSFETGFAFAGSDMDLAIMPQVASTPRYTMTEDDLPRLLEARLLAEGYGAKLLPNTRVPIIKLCEKPDAVFLEKLRDERGAWETLSLRKKYPHLAGSLPEEESGVADAEESVAHVSEASPDDTLIDVGSTEQPALTNDKVEGPVDVVGDQSQPASMDGPASAPTQIQPVKKRWQREREPRSIDFPKQSVGILTDINFYNALGLHNTHLLKCYSACDPRLRDIILFVKTWAKKRKINNTYSGTLSSYGYVLMVLHYLIFVVKPPVLPNLQDTWRPAMRCTQPGATRKIVDDHIVDFWDQLPEIEAAARLGLLTKNTESIGALLAGFFRYYATPSVNPSFHWNNHVISFGMPRGFKHKNDKGWTAATNVEVDGKRVQNFYLLAIEDPFELTHNVARTVHQAAFYAIKDEFARAHQILNSYAYGMPAEDLFTEAAPDQGRYASPQAGIGRPPNTAQAPTATARLAAPPPATMRFDTGSQDAFPTLAGAPAAKSEVQTKSEAKAKPAPRTNNDPKWKKKMQRLDLN